MLQENLKISQETQNLQLLTISTSCQDDLEKEMKKSNDSLLWSYVSKTKKSVVKNLLKDSFPKPSSTSSRRSQSDSFSTDISRCDSPTRILKKSRFANSIYEPIEIAKSTDCMENELASPMLPKAIDLLDEEDCMDEENGFDFTKFVTKQDKTHSQRNVNCTSIKTICYAQDEISANEYHKKSSKSFQRSSTMIRCGSQSAKSNGSCIMNQTFSTAIKVHKEATTPRSPKSVAIHKVAEVKQQPPLPKLRLKGDGRKSGLILLNVARFNQMIEHKISAKVYREFLILLQKIFDNYDGNEEKFKSAHGESVAASILLLAASKVGISKTDFLEALKPWNKKMFTKVEMIKKNACYKQWKKIVSKIVA